MAHTARLLLTVAFLGGILALPETHAQAPAPRTASEAPAPATRPDVAELCINHVKGGIQAIYDKHKYEREIQSALAQWAEHVAALIKGRKSKVVPLRSA